MRVFRCFLKDQHTSTEHCKRSQLSCTAVKGKFGIWICTKNKIRVEVGMSTQTLSAPAFIAIALMTNVEL